MVKLKMQHAIKLEVFELLISTLKPIFIIYEKTTAKSFKLVSR